MNRCIICNEENLQPSDEHILPDSLGGKIIINSVCKKCNSILGETVDSWILNDDLFVVIRDRLKIKNKNGNYVDLSKHFSKKMFNYETNTKAILKKINLDGSQKLYAINPEKDMENISFVGNKVLYNGISDIDLLVNKVEKQAKLEGYKNFDKSSFKEAVLSNSSCDIINEKFYANIYYNIYNYYPECIKMIYEVLYKKYGDKFLNTKFSRYLNQKIKAFMDDNKCLDLRSEDFESELLVIKDLNIYQGKNIANILIERNCLNEDVLVSTNLFNAIIFTILLPKCSELNFIENELIKLN